jgi:hypothetical protein
LISADAGETPALRSCWKFPWKFQMRNGVRPALLAGMNTKLEEARWQRLTDPGFSRSHWCAWWPDLAFLIVVEALRSVRSSVSF